MTNSSMRYSFLYRLLLPAACIFPGKAIIAQNPNPLPALRHAFIVVCHRGDHTHAPENTLAAYAGAIAVCPLISGALIA